MAGRATELRALDVAWRAVSSSGAGGQVAAVVGEAGCGKTRLVEEFRRSVESAGGTVVAARCHDGESGLPFALAADLLRSARSACPDLPGRLPAHVAAMVGLKQAARRFAAVDAGGPSRPEIWTLVEW